MKRSYYRICPACGANLDPGEVCDCLADTLQEARDLFPDRFAGMADKEVAGEIANTVNTIFLKKYAALTPENKVSFENFVTALLREQEESELTPHARNDVSK